VTFDLSTSFPHFLVWIAAAVNYVFTGIKIGVDSSSRFSFRARTHTDTQSGTPLLTLPTHWLPQVCVLKLIRRPLQEYNEMLRKYKMLQVKM